jgi:hypothetical protein
VIAEVYPALWSRKFATEGRTPDQHDAFEPQWGNRNPRPEGRSAFYSAASASYAIPAR